MKESIIIRNFGPIKEIEIKDIRPFTVFIGESGSGKSTIMKVIVLFRWIYKTLNIRSYLKHANISQAPLSFDFNEYLQNNGFVDYKRDHTEIIYEQGNTKIIYNGALNTSKIIIPKEDLSLEKMCFIADKRNLIPDILAARRNDKMAMNYFLEDTYNDFIISAKLINELKIDYLGIKYFSKESSAGTKYFIGNINGDESYTINLEDSSSGTQTVVPLSVIIEYFSKHYNFKGTFNNVVLKYLSQNDNLKDFRTDLNIGDIKHRNIHIHIEEPELSLYPESQRSLINFITNRCFIDNNEDYKMTVMLTTHSPYIINHLNLLIKANDRNRSIEGARLNYDNVSVYQVSGGKMIDLKIQNERLINTNPLSDTINAIYDEYNRLG